MRAKRNLWALVLLMLLAMAGNVGAALTNDGLDYTKITAVNASYSSGAHIYTWGNWWMGAYNESYESAYPSYAAISWDLVATKGTTYNFSGSNIQFTAMNSSNANGVKVQLLSGGTVKWESSIESLGASEIHSFDVPTGTDYRSIDQIRFVFRSTNSRENYEVEMDSFTSTAIPVPVTVAPVFSPAGSIISGPTTVTISSATAGAMIYYTTNGETPTTSGTAYSNPTTVTVDNGTVLQAIAVDTDTSDITSQTYSIACLTNAGLDYTKVTAVNVSYSSGAKIYSWSNWWIEAFNESYESAYPSYAGISWDLVATMGTAYNFSGASIQFNAINSQDADGIKVQLLSGGTVKWQSSFQSLGGTHSFNVPVGTAYRNIDQIMFVFRSTASREIYIGEMDSFTSTAKPVPMTATPVFSPAGPMISGPTTVTISSATAGAMIYYTTNGETPIASGTAYSNPTTVTVDSGTVLQAIAVGIDTSFITSQSYTTELINDFSNINRFKTATSWPVTSVSLTQLTNSFQMDLAYQSWYTEWFRAAGCAVWKLDESYNFSGKSFSVEVMSVSNIDRADIALYSNGEQVWGGYYYKIGSSWATIGGTLPESSKYESIDEIRFYLNCGSEGENPGAGTGSGIFRNFKTFDKAVPVFSPSGPYISGPTEVTISCAAEGASIYYTVNGETPTTSDNLYTAGSTITVSDGTKLKAMAVADGYSSSYTSMTYVLKTISVCAFGGILTDSSVSRYQEMRECGFTHATQLGYNAPADAIKALDDARDGGVRLIMGTPLPGIYEVRSHPALEAYFADDEPTAGEFASVAETVQNIKTEDPNHFCMIHLLPTYAFSSIPDYEDYVSSFVNTVPVEVLCYDHYPIQNSGIRSDFYQNLEIISSDAKAKGIPFWAHALSMAHLDYPIPTLTHLRFQVYSDLAYGAQGIVYFAYWCFSDGSYDFHDAPIDVDGNRTDTWPIVQTMNQEIKGLSPVFLGASVVSIGHTGSSIPAGTTRYTAISPINSLTTSGSDGAVVSQLVNGNENYLVVVNRDINNTMTLNVSVDTTKNFSVVSKDGTKTVLTSGTVSYTVAPADIVVLNWGTPTLSVTPSSRAVTSDAGTTTFAVSNNGGSTMSWSAQVISGSSWASITNGSSGTNSGTISLSYGANTSTTSRTATIRITVTGSTTSTDVTIVQTAAALTPGDANGDGAVNVSDLSLLAANYGKTSGATWAMGDFTGDGAVNVSDLSLLAANYGKGSSDTLSWADAYAQAFGTTTGDANLSSDASSDDSEDTTSSACSSLGLSLIAGLAMLGLMIVKLEE